MTVRATNGGRDYRFTPSPEEPDTDDRDPDEAPETPLDEPRPPRVQDPPPPGQTSPYVVRTHGW